MNIGEKIKRIRQHRRMTQKELGELVNLSANRIAQYEMGYRVPKKPLLNQIAEALRVSPLALSDGGNGPANDILEQLFWLDEEQPGVIKLVPTERGTARYNANPNLALHYDDNDNWPPRSPVAMWFDDTILDDFLKDWAAVQKKLYAGEITQGFGLAFQTGAKYQNFMDMVGIHPTIAEEFTTLSVTKRSGASAKKGGC